MERSIGYVDIHIESEVIARYRMVQKAMQQPYKSPYKKPCKKRGRKDYVCDIGAFRGTNGLVTYPRIIGHEVAGEILSIPEHNKKGLKAGDHVIVDPYLYCGSCYPCSIGRTNCCTDLKVLGVHAEGGMSTRQICCGSCQRICPGNWRPLPNPLPLRFTESTGED